jgi:hypothetical protein
MNIDSGLIYTLNKKAIRIIESLSDKYILLNWLFSLTYKPLKVRPIEKGLISGPIPSFNNGLNE